jgi:hypothetical protein
LLASSVSRSAITTSWNTTLRWKTILSAIPKDGDASRRAGYADSTTCETASPKQGASFRY